MFKYNELSDLIDGSLVTPLSRMDDGTVRCLDKDDNECFHVFGDFDFAKKPEDRIEVPVEPDLPEEELTYQDILDEMNRDDAIFDGTDDIPDPEPDPESDPEPDPEPEKEGFIDGAEKKEVLETLGSINPKNKYVVWKDII